jgi:hypothetical protein
MILRFISVKHDLLVEAPGIEPGSEHVQHRRLHAYSVISIQPDLCLTEGSQDPADSGTFLPDATE